MKGFIVKLRNQSPDAAAPADRNPGFMRGHILQKSLCPVLAALVLCGCAYKDPEPAMQLRKGLLKAEKVSCEAEIIADYGDKRHSFSLECTMDNGGDLAFTVTAPESISGIKGDIRGAKGHLLFEGEALGFPLMADDLMSPVGAPWLMLSALRSGEITSGGRDGEQTHVTISYPYGDENLVADVWLDKSGQLCRGEILKEGRRYLTVNVSNFSME